MATIGINALYVIPNKVGGTEYYLRSFLKYLAKNNTKNEYVIFCCKEAGNTFKTLPKDWKVVICPIYASNRVARIIFEQVVLPLKVVREKCVVLHSFGYFGPLWGNYKKVVTVHDTNWLDHPEDSSFLQNLILNLLISNNVKVADKLIVDSDFSYKQLINHFPFVKEKTEVIYPGVDDDFKNILKLNSHSIIKKKYVLCVSAFYPHKRVVYVLKLWRSLSKILVNYELVLVGQNGKDLKKVKDITSLTTNVTRFEKVDFVKLVTLYKHALFSVIPSVYEGFGYPLYESLIANKTTFVGRKNIYHPSTYRYTRELTFKPKSDARLLLSAVFTAKDQIVNLDINYQTATSKLLKIYTSLLSH